jgi:hypothetical protein
MKVKEDGLGADEGLDKVRELSKGQMTKSHKMVLKDLKDAENSFKAPMGTRELMKSEIDFEFGFEVNY